MREVARWTSKPVCCGSEISSGDWWRGTSIRGAPAPPPHDDRQAGVHAGGARDNAWRWHERFGHLHFDALRKLARDDMVRGLPEIEHIEQLCDCCVATKQRRTSFPAAAKYQA
jgi:hypothetical protein